MLRKGGNTTAVNANGRRKLQTSFPDGSELVEEYDLKTAELMVRKLRRKTPLGALGEWEFLVGDAPGGFNPQLGIIAENSQNPIIIRKDTPKCFQWRIRNLPYPKDVFSVTLSQEDRRIVIRTSTKKYYKRISIPELDLLKLPLEDSSLQWSHAHNTLVISYSKPLSVLQAEKEERLQLSTYKPSNDGDVDCKQQ